MAVGTNSARHIDIQRDFASPASISLRIIRASVLIDFLEAAIGSCTCRQAELRTIGRQVGFSIGIVHSINDGYGLSRALLRRGHFIGALQISRPQTLRGSSLGSYSMRLHVHRLTGAVDVGHLHRITINETGLGVMVT